MNLINFKPKTYALIYLGNIILFSFVYWCFLNEHFKNATEIPYTYLQMLYFSIVSITTLGYGDIIPDLNSDILLITIIFQVSTGIILIGLFLNSLAQKLSDLKDEKIQNEMKENEKIKLSKQMALLKPIINEHLKVLSKIYTVTSTKQGKNYHIKPSELFNVEYYDQVCTLDFFAKTYTLKNGVQIEQSWCEYLQKEYRLFVDKIDNYLLKYSTNLPIETIEILTNIQNSVYINFPDNELSFKNHLQSQGLNNSTSLSIGLTLEHSNSSFDLLEDEKTVKNYHELLLSLIERIDELLPDNKITIFIRLDLKYPGIGSAIGKIELEKENT